MSALPPTTKPADKKATPTTLAPSANAVGFFGIAAVFPFLFLIIFHAGAAYLSYQKYQSSMWAAIDFFFAYFYYPYYAFFLSGTPAYAEPSPVNTMMGGLRKLMGGRRR